MGGKLVVPGHQPIARSIFIAQVPWSLLPKGTSTEAGSSGAGNTQGSAGGRSSEGAEGAGRATPPMLAPGTQADSEADLEAKFGDEILFQKTLPESGATVATREMSLCLTATQSAVGDQEIWRVWLHNEASQNAHVPAGTCHAWHVYWTRWTGSFRESGY